MILNRIRTILAGIQIAPLKYDVTATCSSKSPEESRHSLRFGFLSHFNAEGVGGLHGLNHCTYITSLLKYTTYHTIRNLMQRYRPFDTILSFRQKRFRQLCLVYCFVYNSRCCMVYGWSTARRQYTILTFPLACLFPGAPDDFRAKTK